MTTLLKNKDPHEEYDITFDFSHITRYGILTATVLCSTTIDVSDPLTPDVTNIATIPLTIKDNLVIQRISGGIHGNTYKLVCSATSANGVFVISCEQPVMNL